tara:strand:- start:4751 stop:5719 length:969 start_codon:yes stop_codon:yes gene_type:complete
MPLVPLTDDPASFAHARLAVARPRLPDGLEIVKELGKGSNNKVFRATWDGEDCALRAPRRGSDTQQKGSAVWEFRHTLKASQLGVGPRVYAAWHARHAHRGWPSGLYVITELLDNDLDDVLGSAALRARAPPAALGAALVRCLKALADELIFVFDLKPSNVMVRLAREGEGDDVEARIIDFGRDFCEWAGCEQEPDSNTPVVTMLRKRVRARQDVTHSQEEVDAVVSHVLFAAMLVQLAATTTHCLYRDRRDHRLGAEERAAANPVAPLAAALLDSMQARNVALVREVLRVDAVRGVLRHYHGRRNAGTHRTLGFARGVDER